MRSGIFVGVFCAAALLASRFADDDRSAVAVVDGDRITVDAFRVAYIDYLLETGLPDEQRRRRRFVDRLIAQRLIIREGISLGIEDAPAFATALERAKTKLLVDLHVSQTLYDGIDVSQDELEEMMRRVNTQLTARHLYAATLEAANALHQSLLNGSSFESLAREVFTDPQLALSGGSVGTFSFDEMDPAFEEAAYALAIGETSTPVKTAQGYSIIQLQDRFTKPLLTEYEFAQRKDKLERYVRYRKKIEARKVYIAGLLESANVQFEAGLQVVSAFALGSAPDAVAGGGFQDGEFSSATDDLAVVSFGPSENRSTWTVADFRNRAAYTSPEQRAAVTDLTSLHEFVRGLVARQMMVEQARAAGLHRSELYLDALAAAKDELLYDAAYERLARDVAVEDDDLRAYFDAHSDEFVEPERVRLHEVLVATRAEADDVVRALKSQAITEVAKRTVRPGGAEKGGDLGWVTRSQLGGLGDALFAASAGDIVGPLEAKGHYGVYLVGERVLARPAEFSEAAPGIERQLIRGARKQHIASAVEGLRAAARVEIDEATLYAVNLK